MGEKLPRILPKVATSLSLQGSLHAVNYDMGPTALLPLEGKCAEDFFGVLRIFSPEKSDGFGRV